MLSGKTVAILGAGGSGVAAATLALHQGAEVTVYDSSKISRDIPEGIMLHPEATVLTGKDCVADIVVVSPGIDTYCEFVQAFAEGAEELIGEVELAARAYHGKIIAITGTNGKTTTTKLVETMVLSAGISCVACGNYGVPFAEVVLRERVPDVVALELSSFQLETIQSLKPEAIIWLNFSADHMDRYSSLEAYKQAKLRIFDNATEDTLIVTRSGEELGTLLGERVYFSTESSSDWFFDGTWLTFREEKVIDLSMSRLRGLHNVENVMAAATACTVLGISWSEMQEAVSEFHPPKHRCELVREIDGVEFINDSKATNIHALQSAMRSLSRPMLLIAGGKQKGLDYQDLLTNMSPNVKAVFVFGEIAEDLNQLLSPVVPTKAVETLDTALKLAREQAQAGDLILLSPGTSSFDQFSSYEARGEHFRKLVMNF